MGHLIENGILEIVEGKKVLTEQAKKNFLETVQNILEYGSDGIPEDKKPFLQSQIKIPPGQQPIPDLKNEIIFKDFHKRYLGRYQKVANDLDVDSNYSIPPIVDPISFASSAFNTQLPDPGFPDGFLKYFSPECPNVLLGDLINAGVTDVASPTGLIDLLKTITDKVKAPQIPNIQFPDILPPTPPVIEFGVPELPEVPEIPQIPGTEFVSPDLPLPPLPAPPAPPQVSLSTVSAKELAIVKNLPKLLADIVSKIPQLIFKIANPKELMDTVISSVIESGVMGGSEPTSTIEQAADAVLATKIAEMTLTAALASTIGSGPGSLTTSITQMTSGPRQTFKYLTPPVPEIKEPPPVTPRERAASEAIGIAPARYSDEERRTAYLNALFPRETVLESFSADCSRGGKTPVNVYGEFIHLFKKEDDKKKEYSETELKERFPLGGKINLDKDERLKITPVRDSTGFRRFADFNAEKQSSCGMFLRAMFKRAGCTNKFFTGFYPMQTAISLLILIGVLRNYRWVGERGDDGKLKPNAERGIIDVLYDDDGGARWESEDDSELVTEAKALRKILDKLQSMDNYSNLLNRMQRYVNGSTHLIPPDAREDMDALKKYLKKKQNKALIFVDELAATPPNEFYLGRGDAMLIATPKYENFVVAVNDEYKYNTEHAILTVSELNGFSLKSINEDGQTIILNEENSPNGATGRFYKNLKTVEGGAIDEGWYGRDGKGDMKSIPITINFKKFNLNSSDAWEKYKKKYVTAGFQNATVDIKLPDFNKDLPEAHPATLKYSNALPTAILGSYRVLGAWEKTQKGHYRYYTSSNKLLGENEKAIENKIITGQNVNTSSKDKLIIGIFNVNEYCADIENYNHPKDKKRSASLAFKEMENFNVMKNLISEGLHGYDTLRLTAYFCFGGGYNDEGKLMVSDVIALS